MFQAWWLMEEKEKLPFHLFPFPPQATYLGLHPFPLISRFYFTIILGRYLHIPSFFPWFINYNAPFNVISPPHIHYWFGLVEDPFFFAWDYGVTHGHVLQASNCANEWRVNPRIIFKFNIDVTSSWWKPRTARSVCPSWSRSLSSLVLLHFSELSHRSDFVAGQPCFWWWTWNRLWKLLWDWRHLHFRMVFNSRRWTLSLVT